MSKAHILKAIQHNKPESRPLPDIPGFESSGMDIVQAFGSTSAQNGTRVVNAADFSDLESAVRTLFPEKGKIASTLPDLTSEVNLQNRAPDALVDVDVAVIGGQVGVAEHEAYAQIKIDDTGFGVFIAGPSKTADIEQSLVIGAQGARSLTIILI